MCPKCCVAKGLRQRGSSRAGLVHASGVVRSRAGLVHASGVRGVTGVFRVGAGPIRPCPAPLTHHFLNIGQNTDGTHTSKFLIKKNIESKFQELVKTPFRIQIKKGPLFEGTPNNKNNSP